MQFDTIKNRLIKNIGLKRWEHSLAVLDAAKKLGSIYNLDLEKVYLASLLHDCGKFQNKRDLLKKASDFGIILNEIMRHNMELIHGPLGAKIAELEFAISDQDILNAIRYHTTGRGNMSLLEKVIFLADYIEPSRDFSNIEEVRQLAYQDLDKAILLAINQTLGFLVGNNRLICIDTIKARNYLMIKAKEEGSE